LMLSLPSRHGWVDGCLTTTVQISGGFAAT
jgi:hypothetical protein